MALPLSSDSVRSARNEIQLGKYEYCIAAIAVSPPLTYSSGTVDDGGIHPRPVVPATAITARRSAFVRRSSATTRSACSRGEDADSRPTYTRTGSIAGRPVSAVMSSADGPPATKVRPSRPSVSHATSDAALPDRFGDRGRATSGAVSSSAAANDASTARRWHPTRDRDLPGLV